MLEPYWLKDKEGVVKVRQVNTYYEISYVSNADVGKVELVLKVDTDIEQLQEGIGDIESSINKSIYGWLITHLVFRFIN